jgi:glyoxylase-like metal-dependent hydrolase (beta-lactamase superfamily II)
MQEEYRIHPMPIVRIFSDKGLFTYLSGYGEKIWSPVYTFYLEGPREKILVDTGISAAEMKRVAKFVTQVEDITPFEKSLAKYDLTPEDIDIVIQTHLHSDHCMNTRKCKNARVIVQEAELNFALSPHPLYAGVYQKQWYAGINFETVNGDKEIVPGVSVVSLPGHTKGSQGVMVDTRKGKCIIAGFCALDENFGDMADAASPVVLPGICLDPMKAYDSILKVKKTTDCIIPIHSDRFMNVETV